MVRLKKSAQHTVFQNNNRDIQPQKNICSPLFPRTSLRRFTYDISSGEDGQVDIPGLDVSLGIVSAGAVLKYKFDIVNDGKGETNLNVKLKMDACKE